MLTKVNDRLGDSQRQWAQPGAIATYKDQGFGLSAGIGSVGIVLSHCFVIRENELYVYVALSKKESLNQVFDLKVIRILNFSWRENSI